MGCPSSQWRSISSLAWEKKFLFFSSLSMGFCAIQVLELSPVLMAPG